jgi:hypothetical protein
MSVPFVAPRAPGECAFAVSFLGRLSRFHLLIAILFFHRNVVSPQVSMSVCSEDVTCVQSTWCAVFMEKFLHLRDAVPPPVRRTDTPNQVVVLWPTFPLHCPVHRPQFALMRGPDCHFLVSQCESPGTDNHWVGHKLRDFITRTILSEGGWEGRVHDPSRGNEKLMRRLFSK